jgi:hypothetical protein
MTARMLATLALALGLTAWSGCSTGKDTADGTDDTDGTTAGDDDDDDNAEETAPTGSTGPEYFTPAAIQPYAYFGFDLTTGTLVDVNSAYGAIEPSIEINIGNEEWEASGLDYNRTDLYCVVQLPLTDSTFAPWAQAAGLYYGVDYTGEQPLTSCLAENGFEVDPAWTYGYGDGALAAVFAAQWGVAVGPLTPDGEASLAGYTYASIPEGSFFGGVFYDPLLETMVDGQLAYAEEVDPTMTLTGNFLQASTVNPGNGIATGFYNVIALYYVYFQ